MRNLEPLYPARWVRWLGMMLLLIWGGGCYSPAESSKQTVTVSAAANLIPAFEAIQATFEAESGIEVVYNFGGSGKLAQQIEQGAPVDVFASADTAYVTQLVEAEFIDATTVQPYASGQLVIWSQDSAQLPESIDRLTEANIEQIAIANPVHAPYGVIAKEVLQQARLWEALHPKIVQGDDVRQALTYAETGNVTLALVPLSLVIQLDSGVYHAISEDYQASLTQSLGILNTTPHRAEAEQFVAFVLGEQGQAILQRYGYESAQ